MDWRREAGNRPAWLNDDNSVDLLFPLSYHEGETEKRIASLMLRRLTGKERRMMDAPGLHTDKLLNIVSAMTGHPVLVLERWDSVDQDRLDDVLGYFMEPGSATMPT
jgi:hypothetical protein